MEAITISRIFAFSDANELFDLIHLGQKFLILAVDELNLALLTENLILCRFLIEILSDGGIARPTSCDDLQSVDLLVAMAHFLVQKEVVALEVLVQFLKLSDLLFELVATLVGSSELL